MVWPYLTVVRGRKQARHRLFRQWRGNNFAKSYEWIVSPSSNIENRGWRAPLRSRVCRRGCLVGADQLQTEVVGIIHPVVT